MLLYKKYMLVILSLTYASIVLSADPSVCGDWELIKNEKCIKLINESSFLTFDEAKKACEAEKGATMISIHSSEEQEHISNYLFKEKKIVDVVWIGLRKDKETFKWVDSTEYKYEYWAVGYPTNKSLPDCVQMVPEDNSRGKWLDEPCNKRNLVVCQKIPDLSLTYLKKVLSDVKEIESYSVRQLNDIKIVMKGFFLDIYSDNYSYFKSFNDTDGKLKAFMIPSVANKKGNLTWDKASNVCKEYNSSLVEIQSWEKQIILISFLSQIWKNINGMAMPYFWINGRRAPGENFKWMKSASIFNYTNWYPGYPTTKADYQFVKINLESNDNFTKWKNVPITDTNYVICEFLVTD